MSDKYYQITKDKSIVVSRVLLADSFKTRLVGLMFRDPPEKIDGLLFENCRSIHTHFMTYPLDIIFLNKSNEVIKIIQNMKPWRMTRPYFKASKVFEVKRGSLKMDISPGDRLEVTCIS